MDDVDDDAETRSEPQQGAGILGDVGLVEGEFDGHAVLLFGRARASQWV
jgi:hypothetical protein